MIFLHVFISARPPLICLGDLHRFPDTLLHHGFETVAGDRLIPIVLPPGVGDATAASSADELYSRA